jgi:hypothetical protein
MSTRIDDAVNTVRNGVDRVFGTERRKKQKQSVAMKLITSVRRPLL